VPCVFFCRVRSLHTRRTALALSSESILIKYHLTDLHFSSIGARWKSSGLDTVQLPCQSSLCSFYRIPLPVYMPFICHGLRSIGLEVAVLRAFRPLLQAFYATSYSGSSCPRSVRST